MLKKIILALVLVISLGAYFCPLFLAEGREAKVVFLDVGQGDAALIKLPGRRLILIDGGPDNLVLKRLGESLPFYQRSLDLIIVSHWHDDHIIGLREILERYRVKALIYMEGAEQNNLARDILNRAACLGVRILPLSGEATLVYPGNCALNLLSSLSLQVKDNSNNSLITRLNCYGRSFLLSGDNELAVEKALLDRPNNLSSDVFKASHHGSKTSNSRDFLLAVKPKLAIISVGKDNRFNHPAPEVLKTLSDLGLKIHRTDQGSSIIIRLN